MYTTTRTNWKEDSTDHSPIIETNADSTKIGIMVTSTAKNKFEIKKV